MNFNKFKAGAHKQQYQYKSFSPVKINTTWIWDDPVLNVLLEKATRKLGEQNALSRVRTANDISHWVKFFLQFKNTMTTSALLY